MTKMRMIVILGIMCLALIMVAIPIMGGYAKSVPSKPIKIGLLFALTGRFSALGLDSQGSATTWIEWANKERGGGKWPPIEFILLDSQSEGTKAALAAKRLIEVEKVHAIVGPNSSGEALVVGPVCEENNIPLVTCSASEAFERELKPHWGFRTASSSWEVVDAGLAALRLLAPRMRKLAILHASTAYAKQNTKDAIYFAPLRGFEIGAVEAYEPNATEFGAQISKIKASNPDAVLVYCAEMAGALAIKQMREMGMNKVVMNNGTVVATDIREAFKNTFSIPPYVYVAATPADCWSALPKDSIAYKKLEPIASRYEEKHKKAYGCFHHIPVAGLVLIMNSVERGLEESPNLFDRDLQTIRRAIRDKIETTKDLHTGGNILTASPTNHSTNVPGSMAVTIHFESGKIVYDPQLTTPIKLNTPPQ